MSKNQCTESIHDVAFLISAHNVALEVRLR